MSVQVAEKIEKFFAPHMLRTYPKGQIIIFAGDNPQAVFYLVSGQVKQYDISYRGDEVVLNVFKPGAFFPMSLAMNGGDSPHFFEAETAVEIRTAPAPDVLDFLKANSDVLYDLMSRVYKGLDGVLGRMAHLMASSARSRLLYELTLEARRFGKHQPDGSCLIAITEKDMGLRTGLSRETVNRELHKLKGEKLIAVQRNDIVIKSVVQLEEKLGKDL